MNTNVFAYLDRYGLPLAIIGLALAFFYRAIWPLIQRAILKAESRVDRADEILKSSAEQCGIKHDKLTSEFMLALERRDALAKQSFNEVISELKRMNDSIEGRVIKRGRRI